MSAPVTAGRSERLATAASRVRSRLLFVVLDALILAASYSLAELVDVHNHTPSAFAEQFVVFLVVMLAVQLTANHLFGLYGRMWRHAGIEEARQILLSSGASLAALIALYPVGRATGVVTVVPLIVVVIGGVFGTMAMGALRFHSRLFAWQRGSRRSGLRVAVIGSRDAGAAVVRDMLRNPKAGLIPVAVFDDDAGAHGLSLLGVPVVGGVDDIEAAAPRYDIQQVVLAIPSPSSELVERSLRASEAAGVTMKIVPGVREMAGDTGKAPPMARVRSPRIEDLLGRTQVATDLEAVRASIAGRRVLITGAGGSIGTEISRQVAGFEPSQLVLLDHDETHLYDTAALVNGPVEQVLLDIGDRQAIFEAMNKYRPEVVFHAAAHKHVPLLESHPLAAVSTNVFGTLNVVEAAAAAGTERFVCISTDKAVRPRSVMGASKWAAEQVVLSRAPKGAPYCAVRFGNVLGSRGSVIPTFARQIALGGPVTVTDPRMTRFFMSVKEAVQLVLQASVLSQGGEVFMLEMGKAVSILELAERMIRLSGYAVGTDIPIEITGARPGEKIDEDLTAAGEELLSTPHGAVYRLLPATLAAEELDMALLELDESVDARDSKSARRSLFAMAESAGLSEAVVDEVAV